MDKETLSNYGWIVICVLVLAVMIALATPFGSYVSNAVKSTTQGLFDTNKNALNSTGLINIGDQSFDDGASAPEINRGAGSVIPDDATYTPNGGTALIGNGTNTFPNIPQTGDTYEEGDYTYKYNKYYSYTSWSSKTSQNGWGVRVKDTSKTTYGEIISEIAGQPVKNIFYTFLSCYSLTTAPAMPSSVTDMQGTFYGCSSLKTYVGSTDTDGDFSNYTIPNSVTNMACTFYGCSSLATAPKIPSSVTSMSNTFVWCTSLTTAPAIPSSVTDMTFTFYGCTSLTGTIEVNANPSHYNECLKNTQITELLHNGKYGQAIYKAKRRKPVFAE